MEEKIFGNREIVDEAEFLKNDANTLEFSGLLGLRIVRLILERHFARIRVSQSGDDIAKSALAGAVLADQSVHFSFSQLEVDVRQDRTRIGLGKRSSLQEYGHLNSRSIAGKNLSALYLTVSLVIRSTLVS